MEDEQRLAALSDCVSSEDAAVLLSFAKMSCLEGTLEGGAELVAKAEASIDVFRKREDAQMECLMLMAASGLRCQVSARSDGMPVEQAKKALECARSVSDKSLEAAALHALARAHAFAGQYKECSDVALVALDICNEMQATREAAILLTNMASWYFEAGSPDQAKQLAEDALGYFQTAVSDEESELAALRVLCKVLGFMGELPKAIHVCKKSLTRFRHKSGEQSVLEMWASFYLLREDEVAGIDLLSAALLVAERSGDDKARVRLQTGIASLYAKAGQFSEAEEALLDAERVAAQLGLKRQQAMVLHSKAELKLQAGKYGEALEAIALEEALYQKEQAEKRNYGLAKLFRSEIHFAAGAWQQAFQALSEAGSIFREVGWQEGEALFHMQLSELHVARKELQEGFDAASSACNAFHAAGNRMRQVEALIAMSNLAADMQRRSEAHDTAKCAAEIARGLQNMELLAASLGVLAQACLAASDYDGAINSAEECVELYKQRGDIIGRAYSLALCANGHSKAGHKAEATTNAKAAASIFDALGDDAGKELVQGILDTVKVAPSEAATGLAFQAAADAPKAPQAVPSGELVQLSTASVDAVVNSVREVAKQIIGYGDDDEDLDMDTPLMAAGMGSRQSVMFQQHLQEQLPRLTIPATLAFDYPSIKNVSDLIGKQIGL